MKNVVIINYPVNEGLKKSYESAGYTVAVANNPAYRKNPLYAEMEKLCAASGVRVKYQFYEGVKADDLPKLAHVNAGGIIQMPYADNTFKSPIHAALCLGNLLSQELICREEQNGGNKHEKDD